MLNLPPKTTLGPVNACIYCGITALETKLTDEHIIPLSLGGTYILLKASCLKCADKTKSLEGYAGRHIFQDVRIEHGLPTRRPKERPTHLPLRESFSPSPETAPIRLVPTKNYPGMLLLLVHEPAGILLGHSPDKGGSGYPFVCQITGRERVEQLKDQGIAAKIFRKLQPDLLLRLITKVALGFAVAGNGLSDFDATVQNVILRRDTNPFYWAGGTTSDMDEFPSPSHGSMVLHRVVTYMREIERIPYLLVQLQLFAYLNAPIYTVVVGKLTDVGLNRFKATA